MANSRQMMMAAGGGMAGLGLGNMMADWKNPSDAAMPYMDQIPAQLSKYMDPYINAGKAAIPGLQDQFGKLITDPGGRMNEIGAGFHQSPGFQFALQQALQGSGHAAAAGGMAGSPQHEQQNMELATNLGNQNYNQWLQNALGMYGTGLEGQQNLFNTGAKTSIGMGEDMSSYLANKAKLAYEAQNAENQHEGGMFGSLLGGAGTIAGSIFGGPMGGMVGGAVGG